MSFQTGLSGLNASAKSLDVIGNNIANANTAGMKMSRTEFTDLVASAIGPSGGGGAGGSGIGVAIDTVSQQFSQGNIAITGNSLDLAVNGGGFFQLTKTDGSTAFTRDGQFKLSATGDIITNKGAKVMGFPTDLLGNPTSTTLQPLTVPTGAPIAAQQTANITAEFNLDARAPIFNTVTPNVPLATYGTSLNAFDSQGVPIAVSMYFQKSGLDTWDVYDTNPAGPIPVTTLQFDVNGDLLSGSPATINIQSLNTSIGVGGLFQAQLDLSNVTQYGTAFAVSELSQDGYTAGTLTGLSINEKGVITTRYSNGESQARGQVALADFRNVQGLKPDGGGWVETSTSGQPIQGSPGNGSFGSIRAGALEDSNVDLTGELINMMTAQRNYQANAQTIKTQDQVLNTLVNLR